jgi:hypothetical protein
MPSDDCDLALLGKRIKVRIRSVAILLRACNFAEDIAFNIHKAAAKRSQAKPKGVKS